MKYTEKDLENAFNIGRYGHCEGGVASFEEHLALLKLKVGRWYISDGNLAYYQGWNQKTYGIGQSGMWIDNAYWFNDANLLPSKCKEATAARVKEALVAEAKRRGFKKGAIYIPLSFTTPTTAEFDPEIRVRCFWNNNSHFPNERNYYNMTCRNMCGCIYREGEWAEVIETSELEDGIYSYGGQTIKLNKGQIVINEV